MYGCCSKKMILALTPDPKSKSNPKLYPSSDPDQPIFHHPDSRYRVRREGVVEKQR